MSMFVSGWLIILLVSCYQLTQYLELDTELGSRQLLVRGCTVTDRDGLQQIFHEFNDILMKNLDAEIEHRKSSPQHGNRL